MSKRTARAFVRQCGERTYIVVPNDLHEEFHNVADARALYRDLGRALAEVGPDDSPVPDGFVRVRAGVVVNAEGKWLCGGTNDTPLPDQQVARDLREIADVSDDVPVHWITGLFPIPQCPASVTVEGEVQS